MEFVKYPRTQHIATALRDDNDYRRLIDSGFHFIVEEKMDGTQVGISFTEENQLFIQSRGAKITNEAEFSWLKSWCCEHYEALQTLLSKRHIMFGEWLYLKHTLFYDALPNYFLEFDMYDRTSQRFLSTIRRRELLEDFISLSSVRVIDYDGKASLDTFHDLLGLSQFISAEAYNELTPQEKYETDLTGMMEGLYIKCESQNFVEARYKLIRPDFIRNIIESGSHWRKRAHRMNRLKESRVDKDS